VSLLKSKIVWIVLSLFMLIRIVVLAQLDLFPDEAYYWDWHRFLSLGYYDHPPMIAWLVHFASFLFGDGYWGVKAVPLILGLGILIIMLNLSKRYLKSLSSVILFLLLMYVTLLFAVGGLLLTPDIIFVFFWGSGLLIGYWALFEEKSWAWPLLGVISGMGLLSKYIFVLFIVSFGLYLLLQARTRRLLLTWKPWSALLIAAIVFLPNVFWNATNNWISYVFQLGHGFKSETTWPHWKSFFEFIGSQVGLFSPFLFLFLIVAVVHFFKYHCKDDTLRYLIVFLIVPLLFFSISSLSAKVEANWAAPAFLSGLLIGVWYWEQMKSKIVRFLFVGAVLFSTLIFLIVIIHAMIPFLPIHSRVDRTFDQSGWATLADQVDGIRRQIDPEGNMPLCANRYQLTSLLAFHCQDQPRTWALNLESRENHYSLLEDRQNIINDTLLFVHEFNPGLQDCPYHEYFSSCVKLSELIRPLTENERSIFGMYRVTLNSKGKSLLRNTLTSR